MSTSPGVPIHLIITSSLLVISNKHQLKVLFTFKHKNWIISPSIKKLICKYLRTLIEVSLSVTRQNINYCIFEPNFLGWSLEVASMLVIKLIDQTTIKLKNVNKYLEIFFVCFMWHIVQFTDQNSNYLASSICTEITLQLWW